MIFVTVGTHEQPFNRLVQEVDRLKGEGLIKDEVMIQTGYCTYEPKHCHWKKLLPYEKMWEYVQKADIVITHGGPSSFMMPLQMGKIPIVVPRQKKFGEHVNDHQVEFANAVKERYGNIVVVYHLSNLFNAIDRYQSIISKKQKNLISNNYFFNEKLDSLCSSMRDCSTQKKLKILIINTVPFERNGITSHIFNYFFRLQDHGHTIHFGNTSAMNTDIRNEITKHNITIKDFPNRKKHILRYILKLYQIIKQNHYDIVHVHGNSCTMAFDLLASYLAGCHIRVAHSHNTSCDHQRIHTLLRPLFDFLCTERFACSEEAGKWLFHSKKFDIIPNGISFKQFKFLEEERKVIRNDWKIRENEILIGHIGVFNYQKNHVFLIDVFLECLKKNPNCKLLLVGEGPEKENIFRYVKKRGIEKKVIFKGSSNQIPELLSAMDVFVFPSRFEGLGMVLIEAQAVGLPCVVSDVVPRVTQITKYVKYCSLEEKPCRWAQYILEIEKQTNKPLLKSHINYDIEILEKKLEDKYYTLIDHR